MPNALEPHRDERPLPWQPVEPGPTVLLAGIENLGKDAVGNTQDRFSQRAARPSSSLRVSPAGFSPFRRGCIVGPSPFPPVESCYNRMPHMPLAAESTPCNQLKRPFRIVLEQPSSGRSASKQRSDARRLLHSIRRCNRPQPTTADARYYRRNCRLLKGCFSLQSVKGPAPSMRQRRVAVLTRPAIAQPLPSPEGIKLPASGSDRFTFPRNGVISPRARYYDALFASQL